MYNSALILLLLVCCSSGFRIGSILKASSIVKSSQIHYWDKLKALTMDATNIERSGGITGIMFITPTELGYKFVENVRKYSDLDIKFVDNESDFVDDKSAECLLASEDTVRQLLDKSITFDKVM